MAKLQISSEEIESIINDWINPDLDLSIVQLARKYKHGDYIIKRILVKAGVFEPVKDSDLMDVTRQTPCFEKKIWKAPEHYVTSVGKLYYDISEAPMSDGFKMFGIDAPRMFKGLPEWKQELQKRWNESNGRFGVNYGYEEK